MPEKATFYYSHFVTLCHHSLFVCVSSFALHLLHSFFAADSSERAYQRNWFVCLLTEFRSRYASVAPHALHGWKTASQWCIINCWYNLHRTRPGSRSETGLSTACPMLCIPSCVQLQCVYCIIANIEVTDGRFRCDMHIFHWARTKFPLADWNNVFFMRSNWMHSTTARIRGWMQFWRLWACHIQFAYSIPLNIRKNRREKKTNRTM